MKIGIASTDWSKTIFDRTGAPVSGGAGWIRLQQVRPHLRHQSVTGSLIFHNAKGFGIGDFYGKMHFDLDVLVMQRMMFGNLVENMQDVLSRPNRPIIINDLDDWYWGLDPANAAYELTRPSFNPAENIDHYAEILKLSDVVTVSTPFLKDQMETWLGHKHVVMIENCVTLTDFNVRRVNTKKPIIGWVGSTSHRSRDLEELHGFFDESWRFHHSGHLDGAPRFADALGITSRRVTTSPMLPPQQYARTSFRFDMGIAPLSSIDFNRAKSWIKPIEYCAAGVPFVASRAPEYVRLHETYGIGRLATTKDEWVGHMTELKDHRLRMAEARENRMLVKELDVKVMASHWRELFESLI